MKITLTYHDEQEAKNAIEAPLILAALTEFDQWLRSEIKHKEVPASADVIRERLWELLGGYMSL